MSKAVLLSTLPSWCNVIAHGKKTIEIRKTKPTLEVPFKVYLYCSKPKRDSEDFFAFDCGTDKMRYFYGGGKVIGEFTCKEITTYYKYKRLPHPELDSHYDYIESWWDIDEEDLEKACLSYEQFERYKWPNHKRLYGWHIDDLVIYDTPKPLSEFKTKAPQSWCYVEETEE